jgi:hypothetical protein
VLQREDWTALRVRLAPLLPHEEYPVCKPGPLPAPSRELGGADIPQVPLRRYSIWLGKDAFDGAVCLRLAGSRCVNEVPLAPLTI